MTAAGGDPAPGAQAPAWRDFEQAAWDKRAAPYHQFFAPVCVQIAGQVLDSVAAAPGVKLLDACCGPGYIAGAAAGRGCAALGVDLAGSMVELARALHPGARFRVADVEELPFGAAEFDAVVCNIGIHHVGDPRRAIAEFARVLTPEGVLALTVWDDSRSDLGVVKEAVNAVSPVAPPGIPAPPPRPDYLSEDDVRGLLAPAGLRLAAFTPLAAEIRYGSAQELWDGWLAAAIRTGPLLSAQPEVVRQAARAALDGLLARRRGPDGAVLLRAALMLIVAARAEAARASEQASGRALRPPGSRD